MEATNNKIFIHFRDVVKTPDLAILLALKDPALKEQFKDVIDYTRFEYMNQANLIRLIVQRTDKNILRYLGLKEGYDYDKLYSMLYSTIGDKYTAYKTLSIVESMSLALTSPAISNIYIYSENFEDEIQTDIGIVFSANMNKVKYMYGDIKSCLNDKGISLYITNDIDFIFKLAEIDELRYKEVLLANYGYNYTMNNGELVLRRDLTDIFIQSVFKLNMFSPVILTEENMTQFDNNVLSDNNLSIG